jgi:hypothetical protein
LVLVLAASLAWFGGGCKPTTSSTGSGGHDHDHDHAHSHAHSGPHGGQIVEIGEEEYHAELVRGEAGKVTVYLLDGEVKNEVPIPAESIRIDVRVGNKPQSFELMAVERSEGDPPLTAKFEVVDVQLPEILKALSDGVTATLKVEIGGKPYAATIEPPGAEHKH